MVAILFHDRKQLGERDGLLQKHRRGVGCPGEFAAVLRVRTHHDDRNGLQAHVTGKDIQELEPVHLGHHQIQKDEARVLVVGAQHGESLMPVLRAGGLVAFAVEGALDHRADISVIVDDKDVHLRDATTGRCTSDARGRKIAIAEESSSSNDGSMILLRRARREKAGARRRFAYRIDRMVVCSAATSFNAMVRARKRLPFDATRAVEETALGALVLEQLQDVSDRATSQKTERRPQVDA